jgi:UDP-N-acetyl-D-galactosamine dehydrogenase
MGKYIAEQTIKQMIKNDKKIKDSNILVLGVTFKEDCPDLRNTKVTDIVDELNEYEANVDIYDPWVDLSEVKHHFNHKLMESNPFENDKKYDSIIVAVAHKQFMELTKDDYKNISQDNEIIIDIKGIIDNPTWRL